MHPWIYHHYVEPILYDAGYNPVNTVTWALILGGMILLILRLLRRLEVSFDERFFLATAPYVLAGRASGWSRMQNSIRPLKVPLMKPS